MYKHISFLLAAALMVGAAPMGLAGCSGSQDQAEVTESTETVEESTDDGVTEEASETTELADGEYAIEVETDSSMFRAESCTLKVEDGVYAAVLSLPGEGFSRLYFGTAEDAATADDADVYDYYLNDDGLYTFDIPVEKLDEEVTVAAFGQRRDTWYDHTITFHAPADAA